MSTIEDQEVFSLKQLIIYYVRHWKSFVVAGCISLLLGILYLIFYPKTYETDAMLKIQTENSLDASGGGINMGEAAGLMRSFGLGGGNDAAVNIDDEIATLQSVQLLSKVVTRLGLDVTYEKSFSFEKLYEDSPIQVIPDSTIRNTLEEPIAFTFSAKKNDILIKMEKTGEKYTFTSFPIHLELPEGELIIQRRENVKCDESYKLNITISPVSWVAEALSESITIEDFSKSSNMISLMYEDHSKARAKDLLNNLMHEFNVASKETRVKDGEKSMTFLNERINGIITQLNNIEKEIEQYKLKNQIMDVEYDIQFYSEAIKIYREKLIELEAQKYMVDLLSNYINDPKNQNKVIPSILSGSSSSDGESGSPIGMYNAAIIQREKTRKTSKGDNPLSEIEDEQIEKLREGVLASVENIQISLDSLTVGLKSQEQAILSKMENVPTYEREYIDLKRQQEILQGVYLILLQKKEEVALATESGRDKGFVTEQAYVKAKSIAPRKLYAAIFMCIFTLAVPVIYLFGKEQFLALKKEYKESK